MGTAVAEKLRRHRSIPPGRSPTRPCPNPKCSNRIYLTGLECPRCKTQIPPEERNIDNIHCPECREFIPSDSEECPKCGHRIHPIETPRTRIQDDTTRKRYADDFVSERQKGESLRSAIAEKQEDQVTTEKVKKIGLTWSDALKISVAIAVSPFIHSLLSNTVEAVHPYLSEYVPILVNGIQSAWLHFREMACTFGLFGINCT